MESSTTKEIVAPKRGDVGMNMKNRKAKIAGYYDWQETQDKLYAESQDGKVFTDLMNLITSEENIKLAYRAIKRNKGSHTAGTDNEDMDTYAKMEAEEFIQEIQKQFADYHPKQVRRVEIPKNNGKTRPLGIPCMRDRIVQQCILQVLEPICESKFNDNSYGFGRTEAQKTQSQRQKGSCSCRI